MLLIVKARIIQQHELEEKQVLWPQRNWLISRSFRSGQYFWTRTSRHHCTSLMPLDNNSACYSLFTCCSETLFILKKRRRSEQPLKRGFHCEKKMGATWTGREEGLEESNMRTQVCVSNFCVVLLRKKFTVTAALCYAYQGPHSMHMQTEWYYPLSDTFLQRVILKPILTFTFSAIQQCFALCRCV